MWAASRSLRGKVCLDLQGQVVPTTLWVYHGTLDLAGFVASCKSSGLQSPFSIPKPHFWGLRGLGFRSLGVWAGLGV